ncbi:hypothetical protein BpHYR1_052535 [Brachionus plicatilis]|uniref:Uncharacterized protein n=1 Tax=Brachionus plicatilis TaxID=10195 RepID=A0A3M7PR18_BRAPC|nr:hypothetical protein BpHYR1_052535 [Brachionus plicatilis]
MIRKVQKNKLAKLAKSFSEEPGKTLGFYTKIYSGTMNKIKIELAKVVPADKSFNECWRKAERCLIAEKAGKRKKLINFD